MNKPAVVLILLIGTLLICLLRHYLHFSYNILAFIAIVAGIGMAKIYHALYDYKGNYRFKKSE